ncbi:MAG: DUF4062 domain-containing protein [Nitrosomonas sp.]|uniref:DUF4062 domain-containing protein n=1 Tax=Nitrosomonas sp. TaxID=42353 RepID=UPI002737511F|nr:DUF4062 domain-containing protein [Nitrosomonas sp.]MDP3280084.1 DUF4062 domain-containing protein [Nitrosomonas sp.]
MGSITPNKMTLSRPEIFISATTKDLGTCRKIIKEALSTIECSPVEQTNFPPNAGTVREMLHKRIARCQAVIHLVGEVYGVEPQVQSKDKSRRSYTQMEYDIACELEIPVYIFICANGFPYDTHPAEDEEKRTLQQLHRDKLSRLDDLYEEIISRDDLEKRILALPIRVEQLRNDLYAALNELDNQRTIVRILADSNTRLQAEMAELKLTNAEIFNRAMTSTAERAGIAVSELVSIINLFVSAVRSNPGADFMDLALVDFAEKKFTSAASNAGLAANEAHAKRIAAEELVTHAINEVIAAKVQEREARKLEGQAFYAEKYFEEAIQAFEKALVITPQTEHPEGWADLQFNIGLAFNNLATISPSEDYAKYKQFAVAAYQTALQVYTREALPQGWAASKNNLAIALKDLAQTTEGISRDQLLAEAVAAYRAALEVRTRETLAARLGTDAEQPRYCPERSGIGSRRQ